MDSNLVFSVSSRVYDEIIGLSSVYNVPPETIIIRALELGAKVSYLEEQGVSWQEYLSVVMKIQEKVVRVQSMLSQHKSLLQTVPQIEESLRQAESDQEEIQLVIRELSDFLSRHSLKLE